MTHKGKIPFDRDSLHLTAANMSISRKLFFDLEGFDERLTDAEDYDLAVRAYERGIQIFYDHTAFAWHDDFVTAKSYFKRRQEYKKAHDILFTINPKLYKKYNNRRTKKNQSKLFPLLAKLISNEKVLNLIDSNGLLILPKKIRYRLYDLIFFWATLHLHKPSSS
ncbi:MAG: hypothetical protein AAFO82_15540 [Bacteroidota bacterium]